MSRLRVTAGDLGGQRIAAPRGPGARPTTELVREAIFSILGDVRGAEVLDLFCGSGALGIEALSRGASRATFVDRRVGTVRRNVSDLSISERAMVVRSDVTDYLRTTAGQKFDLILCDPPYRLADRFAAELDPLIPDHLAAGGRVVVESSPTSPLTLSLSLRLERGYGDTLVRVYDNSDGTGAAGP